MGFKVGDRVQNISTDPNINPENKWKIGSVIRVDRLSATPYSIRYDDGCYGKGASHHYKLLISTKKKKMKKLKYKVGQFATLSKDSDAGDYKKGEKVYITEVNDDDDFPYVVSKQRGSTSDGYGDYDYVKEDYILTAGKIPKVNFLLKYDLDEDPVEEFETMAEVKDRIAELVKTEETLKQDSIVVYEVKSVKRAKITITIN